MLNQSSEAGREVRNLTDLVRQNLQANHNMAEQLTFGTVAETAEVRKLFDLADIVQNRAREHKVQVYVLVMAGDQPCECTKRQNMFQ